ncbi:hypothetical protein HYH03_016969 [Edaphochlamys debaryana]|uniref:Glycosyl hydrolase family 32 N-terminal domain-containing protein n=1 Tax=Edaphochlamys debaryana TaxID=47281 RepID=A0A835XQD8_9CHLO|nr:hypothetical protein HYH03_016969 [Edaphochlamys debaryana]|eukprot:KAG2484234.1 hypothetical protein HYH03_016969 [Edaphochlamys debaryana]
MAVAEDDEASTAPAAGGRGSEAATAGQRTRGALLALQALHEPPLVDLGAAEARPHTEEQLVPLADGSCRSGTDTGPGGTGQPAQPPPEAGSSGAADSSGHNAGLSASGDSVPAATGSGSGGSAVQRRSARVREMDSVKPSFHVMPASGWGSDPNGPIFYKGRYHLFYQARPGTCQWHWGVGWEHVVSTDLATWQRLPPAIFPTEGGADADGCFSGSIAVEPRTGVPVCFYTGARLKSNAAVPLPAPPPALDMGLGHIESQCCAVCDPDDDLLISWRKVPMPLMEAPHTGELQAWRDPWFVEAGDGAGREWTMLIGSGLKGAGGTALVYRSADITRGWRFVGELCRWPTKELGEVWECPFLVQLQPLPLCGHVCPTIDLAAVAAAPAAAVTTAPAEAVKSAGAPQEPGTQPLPAAEPQVAREPDGQRIARQRSRGPPRRVMLAELTGSCRLPDMLHTAEVYGAGTGGGGSSGSDLSGGSAEEEADMGFVGGADGAGSGNSTDGGGDGAAAGGEATGSSASDCATNRADGSCGAASALSSGGGEGGGGSAGSARRESPPPPHSPAFDPWPGRHTGTVTEATPTPHLTTVPSGCRRPSDQPPDAHRAEPQAGWPPHDPQLPPGPSGPLPTATGLPAEPSASATLPPSRPSTPEALASLSAGGAALKAAVTAAAAAAVLSEEVGADAAGPVPPPLPPPPAGVPAARARRSSVTLAANLMDALVFAIATPPLPAAATAAAAGPSAAAGQAVQASGRAEGQDVVDISITAAAGTPAAAAAAGPGGESVSIHVRRADSVARAVVHEPDGGGGAGSCGGNATAEVQLHMNAAAGATDMFPPPPPMTPPQPPPPAPAGAAANASPSAAAATAEGTTWPAAPAAPAAAAAAAFSLTASLTSSAVTASATLPTAAAADRAVLQDLHSMIAQVMEAHTARREAEVAAAAAASSTAGEASAAPSAPDASSSHARGASPLRLRYSPGMVGHCAWADPDAPVVALPRGAVAMRYHKAQPLAPPPACNAAAAGVHGNGSACGGSTTDGRARACDDTANGPDAETIAAAGTRGLSPTHSASCPSPAEACSADSALNPAPLSAGAPAIPPCPSTSPAPAPLLPVLGCPPLAAAATTPSSSAVAAAEAASTAPIHASPPPPACQLPQAAAAGALLPLHADVECTSTHAYACSLPEDRRWLFGCAPDACYMTGGLVGTRPMGFIGHYDPEAARYDLDTASPPLPLDMGNCLYAPSCFKDPQGRHIMWAYMKELRTVPPAPSLCTKYSYAGCVSLPRALYLRGDKLFQLPLPELTSLRTDVAAHVGGVELRPGCPWRLAGVRGLHLDIELAVSPGTARRTVLLLHSWRPRGRGAAALVYDWPSRRLFVVFDALAPGRQAMWGGEGTPTTAPSSPACGGGGQAHAVSYVAQHPAQHASHVECHLPHASHHPQPHTRSHLPPVAEEADRGSERCERGDQAGEGAGAPYVEEGESDSGDEHGAEADMRRQERSRGEPRLRSGVAEWLFERRNEAGGILDLPPGAPLRLRLFLDASALEVFTGTGQALTTHVYRGHPPACPPPSGPDPGIELRAVGGCCVLDDLHAYEVQGCWDRPQDAPLDGRVRT